MPGLHGRIHRSRHDWLVGLMSVMGGLGTGVAVLLENLFPPIPSEVILPLAGFTAAQGHMTLAEAIVGATIGSVVGALMLYGIAYAIGAERMRRLCEKMPLTDASDDRFQYAVAVIVVALVVWYVVVKVRAHMAAREHKTRCPTGRVTARLRPRRARRCVRRTL